MVKYSINNYQKDPGNLHLYVRDIRILTTKEYETLKSAIPKDLHKTVFDILLITGMRYIEMLRLHEHREWYNQQRNLIHLNEEAQKKVKRKHQSRTIHPLPSMFNYILKDFWEGKSRQMKQPGIRTSRDGQRKQELTPMAFLQKQLEKQLKVGW